jgi:hypothetical protein
MEAAAVERGLEGVRRRGKAGSRGKGGAVGQRRCPSPLVVPLTSGERGQIEEAGPDRRPLPVDRAYPRRPGVFAYQHVTGVELAVNEGDRKLDQPLHQSHSRLLRARDPDWA